MSRSSPAPLRLAVALAVALGGAVVASSCAAPRPPQPAPSPTAAATFTFRRGVNVNHWLASNYDEAHRYGGPWFDAEDLQWIAAQGFDHVRIRTSGQEWARPDGTLDDAKLAPFERALAEARRLGLGVVLAMTRFPGVPVPEEDRPVELTAAHRGTIAALWRAVATRYAGEGELLRFELIHGPHLRDPRQLAELQAQALAEIRAVSPARFVYFTSNQMSFAATAPLPPDPWVGLALMYWEPEIFTFQIRDELPPVTYPGIAPDFTAAAPPGDPVLAASRRPLAIADLDADFAALAAWIDAHAAGREIYIAQFGVYHRAADDSARRYIRAIRAALDRHRLAWAVYDYESGCAVRGKDGAPTRILDALALRAPPVREARYVWLDAGKPVGSGSLRLAGDTIDAAYQLDDGSAGLQLELTLDERGVPRRYVAHAPVPRAAPPPATTTAAPAAPRPAGPSTEPSAPRETWQLDGTAATWTTSLGSGGAGRARLTAPAYYIPVEEDPFTAALLARALLAAPSRRLPLFPAGEATLEELATHQLDGPAGPRRLTAYAVVGLALAPTAVWLDEHHQLFASLDDGYGPIAAGHELAAPVLEAAATAALTRRAERAAAAVTHRPAVGIFLHDARLFDPIRLEVIPATSVLILGDKISAVARDGQLRPPPGVEVIDARGRFLMPGLWDSHAHLFGRARAILHLAAGVTTVRDLGNESDVHTLVRRAEAGLDVGPRALLALRFGWAPSPGFPPVPQVHSADEARALAESARARGYVQLKILDDLDPRWVPVLAEAAHTRGLRLSGHVPAKMSARQFLEAGADEIQHAPALLRPPPPPQPLPPDAPRPPLAVTPAVRELLADMARRGATLDPTLARFEVPAEGERLTPVAAALAARLPPLELRAQLRNAPDPERRARWAQLSAVSLELVKAAHDAGVPIVPGSDELLAGFLLHRELELYVRAGIPAAQALRMATHGAARNMRRDHTSGSISPGKDADLVLIDGDPTQRIADLARVELVIKRGWRFLPAELLRLVSLRGAG